MPTIQQLASAFVHANSAHQHVPLQDAENPKKIVQNCVSVRNVSTQANNISCNVRHASIDSVASDASISFCTRPSLSTSTDSGIGSLVDDASHRIAPNTMVDASTPQSGVTTKINSSSAFIPPNFGYRGQASLPAKFSAATLRSSPRLLMYLMTDVLARDVELGKDCDRQEAASALKAMAKSAETTLRALSEENAVTDRHCTFIASLHRCETVLISLDELHGYSRRSRHSSRRLIMERTCAALKGIHEKYDASKQLLIEAHDRRPYHEMHRGDLDILLRPESVIHLMRHGAGKSVATHKRIATYQTRLLDVRRRSNSDYAEPSQRL